MPPKNKGRGGKKGRGNKDDSTPTTEYVPKQNQDGFPRAETEEEKTIETQESQGPISHHEIPDSTPKNTESTTEPVIEEKIEETVQENIQATEQKIEEVIQETKVEEPVITEPIAEPIVEAVEESLHQAEEKLEEVIQETQVEEAVVTETVVEPIVEAVQENIEAADAKLEQVIAETEEVVKKAAPGSLDIPVQNAEESRPLSENRLFTIESEGDKSFQQPRKISGAVENVITEEQEADGQDSTQRSILEEKEQVVAPVEPAQELTSSLQNNWDEMRTEKPAADLTKSHIVVDNSLTTSQAHDITSAELQGSLSKNWEEVNKTAPEKRPSLFVQDHDDDIRSDKASDNALQTRLMDEYADAALTYVPSTFSTNEKTLQTKPEEYVDAALTFVPATFDTTSQPADRLRKAEDLIAQGKGLKEDGKPEEAIATLLSAIQSLNPEGFSSQDQAVLTEVNQRIRACTIELADCYNLTNNFEQSIKYARAVLNNDVHNIRAVYLLGIGLIRIGDLDEAHSLLRESKNFPVASVDTLYSNLIDKELEKLDQIAESKSKTPRATSAEEYQPLLNRNATGSVDEVPEEKLEQGQEEGSQRKTKGSSAAEYFLGSLISTSALSFAVAKYLFKFPTKKGVLSAIVVGAVVGGVSLVVQSAIKKNEKKDKQEKN